MKKTITMKKENNDISIIESILFIDFENIQKININDLDIMRTQVYIFVGSNQQKIPVDLVIQTQKLSNAVKWIKIEGQGKNALDFHIAFMLGTLNQNNAKDIEFKILSKDAGFDPLVLYINNLGRKCVRITSIL